VGVVFDGSSIEDVWHVRLGLHHDCELGERVGAYIYTCIHAKGDLGHLREDRGRHIVVPMHALHVIATWNNTLKSKI
jgi:hypothetical protein